MLKRRNMVSIWWLLASFVLGGWFGMLLGALIYMSARSNPPTDAEVLDDWQLGPLSAAPRNHAIA